LRELCFNNDVRFNHRIAVSFLKKHRADAWVCVPVCVSVRSHSIALNTTHPRQDSRTRGKAGDRSLKR
jgi:hypothetical protein